MASQLNGLWAGCVLVLQLSVPASAAQRIQLGSREPRVDHFDDAARLAGLRAWSEVAANSGVIRVLLVLTGRSATLIALLPPGEDPTEADSWFRGTADATGWSSAELSRIDTRDYRAYQAELYGTPETVVPGRSRFSLDSAALVERLRLRTPSTVLLGVRCMGADDVVARPSPTVRARSGSNWYLFYAIPAGARPKPLHFEFGLATRFTGSLLAAGFLLWLFPPVMLLGVRELLLRNPVMEPRARLGTYQRWQGRIVGITWLSSFGILLVGSVRLLYLVTTFRISPLLLFPLIFAPLAVWELLADRISRALRQAAFPDQKAGHDTIWGPHPVRVGAGCILALFAPIGLFAVGRVASGPLRFRPLDWTLWLLICAGCYRLATGPKSRGRVGLSPLPKDEPDAPPELSDEIRRIAGEFGHSVDRVVLREPWHPGDLSAYIGTAPSNRRTAAIPAPMAREIPAAEWAALIAAAVVSSEYQQKTERLSVRLGSWSCLGMMLPVSLLLVTLFSSRLSIVVLSWLILGSLVFAVWYKHVERRLEAQRFADIKRGDEEVARALPDPMLLLSALRRLVEVSERDPARVLAASALAARIRALEHTLGVDER